MSWVATALAVSGAMTAYSQIQQGKAAKAQGEAQSRIAARNAQMAERQAEEQRVAAAAEAVRIEEQGEALKSRQRALFAKSGVEAGKGSPLAVLVDTASKTAADAAEVRRQGVISSISSRAQGDVLRAQGVSAKARGRAAGRASVLSGVGTGISGVASIGASRAERGLKPFGPGKA